MISPILELNNVGKSYPNGAGNREVLRGVNLSIREGEFVCIVGYSGAGKSTLINMIAGLSIPDEGEILLNGEEVCGPSLDRGLIFQNYSLLPWLSALRNVELAVAQCCPGAPKAVIRERTLKYLKMVKLDHASDRKPAELSGGMRQRVALARGLAMEPKILLLDEPLSALDALTRAELQDELARIQSEEKRTVLMITNDVDEGILLADRIVPLSAGPAATLGEPIPVTVERPRVRSKLNNNPRYHDDRKKVLHYLLRHGPRDLKLKAGGRPNAAECSLGGSPAMEAVG